MPSSVQPEDAVSSDIVVIEAGRTEREYWKDLWRYRELFYFLAWRDILVRYKQTAVGMAWSVLRPLLTMLVFTVVFGKLARLPAYGVPYPLLVLVGMLPWQLFSNAMQEGSNSLILSANMITKIYFPRLIAPASNVVVSVVDFLISLVILACFMAWYRVSPSAHLLTLPLFLALVIAASFGAAFWLSALTVKYRDFRFLVPFIVQFGLYISPVAFSSRIVPDKWRLLYALNPMVGLIEGFRWAVLGKAVPGDWPDLVASVVVVAAVLASGVWYFRRTERTFADVI
jgi:lipopolysaccharide transport system permease protein